MTDKLETDALWMGIDEINAINSINGIYDYVREARKIADKFPSALPVIESFEGWYGALAESARRGLFGDVDPGIYRHRVNEADVNEAQRRKADLNAIIGEHIPDTWVPAQGQQTPADKPEEHGLESSLEDAAKTLGEGAKAVVTIAGVGLGAYILYKIFGD